MIDKTGNQSTRALEGLLVLDVSENISGPYCTKLLGSFGAQVIKIERPGSGDPSRKACPFLNDSPHPEEAPFFCI